MTAQRPPRAAVLMVCILSAAATGLWFLTVFNLAEIADNHLVIAQRKSDLDILSHRLNSPAADGKPVDLSSIYIVGQSPGLASANLQQLVVESVTNARGKVIETAVVEVTPPGESVVQENEIRMRISFEVDNAGLFTFLRQLETGVPFVDVQKLSIRRIPGEDSLAETLRVDAETSALWKSEL